MFGFQDITADEAQGFRAYGEGYAIRDHGFQHGYLLHSGATRSPNADPKFYYHVSSHGSGVSKGGFYTRESAIEAGMAEAKRLKGIADAMHRDEMKRIQMLMK